MGQQIHTPRGTKDILPEEQKYWRFVRNVVERKCEVFGCGKIDIPIFEYAEIFTKGLGADSDVVTKEMYEVRRATTIQEQLSEEEEKRITILRPEMTAGIVRAYIQHGMKTWPQPVKLYYQGPNFRYERPQSGRLRIFNQFGVEIVGDTDPLTDASVIFLAYQIMKNLGLANDLTIDINSVGCPTCRPKMRKRLVEYFEKFLPSLCVDCNRRFVENPLRILDCKEQTCQRVVANAPQLIDMLCSDCKTHFKAVLENLENLQIPYNLNPRLVRGLDYYTKTVFEFYDNKDTGRQTTLLGGGRYDNLVKLFGEPATPAIGFAGGIERIIDKIKEKEIEIPDIVGTKVCIVQIGEKAQKKTLPLMAELEDQGIEASCVLGKDSLKSQLRIASKMNAFYALIIGQREVLDKSVIVRNMVDASQETVKMDKLIAYLKDKLGIKE